MKTMHKMLYLAVSGILVLILLLAVFGNKGLIDLNMLKKQQTQLVEKNSQITIENRQLIDEINRLKIDLDYVEAVARKELGLVSENELVFKPQ